VFSLPRCCLLKPRLSHKDTYCATTCLCSVVSCAQLHGTRRIDRQYTNDICRFRVTLGKGEGITRWRSTVPLIGQRVDRSLVATSSLARLPSHILLHVIVVNVARSKTLAPSLLFHSYLDIVSAFDKPIRHAGCKIVHPGDNQHLTVYRTVTLKCSHEGFI
jgi:hypothetical protein